MDAAIRARVAAELERLFQQSGVKSYEGSGDDKHILGFWGEGGQREGSDAGRNSALRKRRLNEPEAQAHGNVASAKGR